MHVTLEVRGHFDELDQPGVGKYGRSIAGDNTSESLMVDFDERLTESAALRAMISDCGFGHRGLTVRRHIHALGTQPIFLPSMWLRRPVHRALCDRSKLASSERARRKRRPITSWRPRWASRRYGYGGEGGRADEFGVDIPLADVLPGDKAAQACDSEAQVSRVAIGARTVAAMESAGVVRSMGISAT